MGNREGAPLGGAMAARAISSFKAEIARVRAMCAEIEPNSGKLDADDEGHLARWEYDGRAEDVWRIIQTHAFGPIPCDANRSYEPLEGFVVLVLATRRISENVESIHRRQEYRRARYLKLAQNAQENARVFKGLATGNSPERTVATNKARLRAEIYESDAQMMRKLAEKIPMPSMRISRMNRSGSRKRVAFMNCTSGYMNHLCGQPFDDVVAVLTDIAFPGSEATTLEQVRSARRNTTRRGRAKNSKLDQK